MKLTLCCNKCFFIIAIAGFFLIFFSLSIRAQQPNFFVSNPPWVAFAGHLYQTKKAGLIAKSHYVTLITVRKQTINAKADLSDLNGTWKILIPAAGSVSGREENAYAAAGNKFYMLGGTGLIAVQEYDPLNNKWVNKAKPPVELHHFQGVTFNGLIYAAGAMNGRFPHEVPLDRVYVYNPVSDKWISGSVIPVGRRRGAAGAVTYNNKIYIAGGITDGHYAGWVNWFDEYDPATNTWKILPAAPRVRDHCQAVVLNNKLYLAGGRRSSVITNQTFDLTIPEVDVYDFTNGTWSTLPAKSNLPMPRAGAANVVFGKEIIVIGGESGMQTQAHKETHALNTETNTWRRLPDLQAGRHGTGAIVNNGDIYIASGAGNRGGTPLLTTQENYFVSSHTSPVGTALVQSKLSAASTLNLGPVNINVQTSKILTLSNSGSNQDVLISAVTINGSGYFSYSAPFPLPFTISPGKSLDITVQFKPATTVGQTANLVITHSGQAGSTTISLSGTAMVTDNTQQVTSFSLINALTNNELQTLNTGEVLNLAVLASKSLNIRANTNPAIVGSVVFVLSGQENKTKTESTRPLALFGGSNGNYNSWTPAVGSYTLKATPYSKSGGKGTAGKSLTINFTIIDAAAGTPQAVTSFTLINAIDNQDIHTINDGDVVDLSALSSGSLNIRANTVPDDVGSVIFELSGQVTRTQTETKKPIALFGDHEGIYNSWAPAAGSYVLKATPYLKGGGTGTAGTSLIISFSVIETLNKGSLPVASFTPVLLPTYTSLQIPGSVPYP